MSGSTHAFLNLVSHELRTPLTIATGMLHVYRRQQPDTAADLDHLLDRSEAALARLGRLTEELILMTRLAAGDLVVRHDPVAASDVLDEVRWRAADPTRVTVRSAPDLLLRTDRHLLGRVLDALVENALVHAGDAEVVARPGTVEVCDHGPGMPDDVLARLADRLADAAPGATTGGLGLGLSFVRALVAELGGDVAVRSTPGAGTVVRVDLGT